MKETINPLLRALRIPIFIILAFFFLLSNNTKASQEENSVERGKVIFNQTCSRCHTIGKGRTVGPDLQGVTERRERKWLVKWILDPGEMIMSGDPIANRILEEFEGLRMPNYGLAEQKISDVLDYLESREEPSQETVPLLFKSEEKQNELVVVSNSYLQWFEDARDNKHAPFYEHFEFELRDKEKKWIFSSSGWLRYDLRALSFDERKMDELTYAFLRYSPFKDRHVLFNIGRHFIFEGVSSEQIDGISSKWEFTQRTGISLFGGIPVEAEFDGRDGDFIYGGRVFQRVDRKAEGGVSFLQEFNDGSRYREEFGIDLFLLPVEEIALQGHSFLNTKTGGWMEHSYNLRLFPSDRLTFSGLLQHTQYDDAFAPSTLDVFSPDFLGKDEEMTKISGSVMYRFNMRDSVVFTFTGYEYEKSGSARYYGTMVVTKIKGISTGLSLHRMEGDTDRLRYIESRAYATKNFNHLTLSVDCINLHYDNRFSNLKNAYTINGTANYRFTDSFSAGISVDYRKDPDSDHETRVLLSLAYNLKQRWQ
jgi:mono/diheme cytochrome c family protein